MQTPLQLDSWLQSYAGFDHAKINIKQRNLTCFCQYLKNNISDIELIPLDHVIIMNFIQITRDGSVLFMGSS